MNPDDKLSVVPSFDRIIHEPVRLGIMKILAEGYVADFVFLKKCLGITDGNLAGHLRVLEDGGYVCCQKEFIARKQHTSYTATNQGSQAYHVYVQKMIAFLSEKD